MFSSANISILLCLHDYEEKSILDRVRKIYKKFPRIPVPQHLGDDEDMQQLSEALGAAKIRVDGCSSFLKAAIKWANNTFLYKYWKRSLSPNWWHVICLSRMQLLVTTFMTNTHTHTLSRHKKMWYTFFSLIRFYWLPCAECFFFFSFLRWSAEFGAPKSGSPELHAMLAEYMYSESPEVVGVKQKFLASSI